MATVRQPDSAASANDHQADLHLAARCVHDAAACEELFRRHAPEVYALARRLLGRSADVDDIVQEVFAQVFASIGRYRGEASLSSWLYRIAVRCAMHHLRKRGRSSAMQLELVGEMPSSGGPGEHSVHRRRILRRLYALLERLSPRRRVIFLLHEVEGRSLPEAAALLGISVTAAKKCVWRARRDIERLARKDPLLRTGFEPGSEDGA